MGGGIYLESHGGCVGLESDILTIQGILLRPGRPLPLSPLPPPERTAHNHIGGTIEPLIEVSLRNPKRSNPKRRFSKPNAGADVKSESQLNMDPACSRKGPGSYTKPETLNTRRCKAGGVREGVMGPCSRLGNAGSYAPSPRPGS